MAAVKISSGLRSAPSLKEGLLRGAVHVKVLPRPRNLGESREILRVLEKYGEIVMYKHLKYEPLAPAPNTILAIYRNIGCAQRLIGASPLRFRLELKDTGWKYLNTEMSDTANASTMGDTPIAPHQEETGEQETGGQETGGQDTGGQETGGQETEATPDKSHSEDNPRHPLRTIATTDSTFRGLGGSQKWGTKGPTVEQESSLPSASSPRPPMPALSAVPAASEPEVQSTASSKENEKSQAGNVQYRDFELKITQSDTNHQAYIERQGYYGPFTPDKKTIMAKDLMGRVPLEGLLDCDITKPEVPLRMRIKRTENGTFTPFSLKALYEKNKELNGTT